MPIRLIHDDLPAMDDDDLRRGRPSCHKQYDAATAILAGDALQPLAYEVIANEARLSATSRMHIIKTLALAKWLVGHGWAGRCWTVQAEGGGVTIDELETMHGKKTAALIAAAVRMGALCGRETGAETLAALATYGRCVGVGRFSVQDDILDEVGDTKKLGKPQGSDRAKDKSTFVALCGLDAARCRAAQLLEQALQALAQLPHGSAPLANLARYIVRRDC